MRIPVTKPFLPSGEAYKKYVDEIWEREWLTNHGPLVTRFEEKLRRYLDTPHLSVITSGTFGLQFALKRLPRGSEVITTPFSYVATTASIVWEGYKPVFADVDPTSLNIDPEKAENAITGKTSAILATHVYGNPCDIDRLEAIARKHNLTLIFDAAHAFGTRFRGESVLNYGDYSALSFHATKLFHTVNGGAIVSPSEKETKVFEKFRNFGHIGVNAFEGMGVNAKMCEFHSAMGLLNLENADEIIARRRKQWFYYRDAMSEIGLKTIKLIDDAGYNAAYFPVVFRDAAQADRAIRTAAKQGIEFRRYFYPSLNKLDYVSGESMPVSEGMAPRICCLPLYHELRQEEQDEIITLIRNL